MSLLQQLTELGDNLIAGEVPAGHEVPKIVAGIVHFLETGTLAAPERAPSEAVQRQLNEEQAEIARLRSQVETLMAERTQAPTPPAPPAPTPPVPEPQAAPAPPPLPVPPAGGQAVAPVAPQPPADQA